MMVADYRREFDGQLVLRDATAALETGSVARASRHPDNQPTDVPRWRVSFCPERESERNVEHPNGIDCLVPTVQALRNNQRKEHP
jgi:hypothetical protein